MTKRWSNGECNISITKIEDGEGVVVNMDYSGN